MKSIEKVYVGTLKYDYIVNAFADNISRHTPFYLKWMHLADVFCVITIMPLQ